MTTHEEIAKKAHELWEKQGRPEGKDLECWCEAEAQLLANSDLEEEKTNKSGTKRKTT